MRIPVLVSGLMAIAACATTTPRGGAAPDMTAAGCETGRVATMGPAPGSVVVLERPREARLVLQGPTASRIRLLVGAVVTACGSQGAEGRMDIASFELREVDGMPAYLGVLRVREGEVSLDPGVSGRPPVPLTAVPPGLREADGQEVWVAGAWDGDAFSVRSYGLVGVATAAPGASTLSEMQSAGVRTRAAWWQDAPMLATASRLRPPDPELRRRPG